MNPQHDLSIPNAVDSGRPPLPPWAGTAYVLLIFLLGSAVVATSLAAVLRGSFGYAWWGLAALTVCCGAFVLKVPSVPATVTISELFVFTTVLCFGWAPAMLTVAADGLITALRSRRRTLRRVVFNCCEPPLSLWIAWNCFSYVSGLAPLRQAPAPLGRLLLPTLTMSGVYFLLNSFLTALAVVAETGGSTYRIWRSHFAWLSLSYFAAASIALFLSSSAQQMLAGLGAALPLVAVLYITFKVSLERIDDTNSELDHVNKLYVATVESLATALDARDHQTHGHVRRVQSRALALARRLRITDAAQLKAIEVAALLHDTGKIAIPDDILNKPGTLTPAEYDRMKQHASVGAEILSHVDFPYPVVPIVRHHHENFDGTGYPDGLRGAEIPIGARILSVIDCYDALVSDRPYRGALSREAALAIVRQRSGSMYDPTVVDAFLEIEPELANLAAEAAPPTLVTAVPSAAAAWEACSSAGTLTAATVDDASPFDKAGRWRRTLSRAGGAATRRLPSGLRLWSRSIEDVAAKDMT